MSGQYCGIVHELGFMPPARKTWRRPPSSQLPVWGYPSEQIHTHLCRLLLSFYCAKRAEATFEVIGAVSHKK